MDQRSSWKGDPDIDAEFATVERIARTAIADRRRPRVLEAGCGTRAHITFGDDAFVVGIDESPRALEQNVDVDEPILGDVATHPFDPGSFDAVVSVYVLEHVRQADDVIRRLVGLLAPGGVLVVVVPNLRSPKAIITKYTPHRFHVFVRRRLLHRPNAGTPGHGPFPTVLHPAIAPTRMLSLVEGLGLTVLHTAFFEDGKQRQLRERFRVTGRTWALARTAVRVLSAGRLDAERSEFMLVARRPDAGG